MNNSKIIERDIGIGGDFLQHCYSMALECIKIHIVTNGPNWKNIILQAVNGLIQEDIILKKRLYDHIYSLGITLKIEVDCNSQEQQDFIKAMNNKKIFNLSFEDKICDNYVDVLIIDKSNHIEVKQLIDNCLKYVNKGIIINCPKLEDLPDSLNDFIKKKYNGFITYLENINTNINYKSIIQTMYQYELIEAIHKIFTNNNIKYCAIEKTCLGCVRNRSQLIGEKLLICREAMSQNKFDKIALDFKNNYKIIISHNRIYFEKHSYIFTEVIIYSEHPLYEMLSTSKIKTYPFGPTFINSLENPIDYLKSLYGKNVFKQIKNSVTGVVSRDPKRLYDFKYNYWSPYTSQFWKNIQIEFVKRIDYILKKHNIPYWLDGGSLLGTIRNGNIPLFDDDIDIGIFKTDLHKVNNILIKYKNYISETPLTQDVSVYLGHNIQFTIRWKTLGVKFSSCKGRLNETAKHGRLGWIEIMGYYPYKDSYICDDYGFIEGNSRERILKTRVSKRYYDERINLTLGNIVISCPSDPVGLLESPQRYGPGTIQGPAKRGMKTLGVQHKE